MKVSAYKSHDGLPLFLNAATEAKVLGIAPSSAYELMHEADFPVLKIGNRLVVMVVCDNHFTSGPPLWAFFLSVQLHFTIDRGVSVLSTQHKKGAPPFGARLKTIFNPRHPA